MANVFVSLMQALGHSDMRSFGDSTGEFSFTAPERAATMEPIGENVPDYLCLVMPLRLLD